MELHSQQLGAKRQRPTEHNSSFRHPIHKIAKTQPKRTFDANELLKQLDELNKAGLEDPNALADTATSYLAHPAVLQAQAYSFAQINQPTAIIQSPHREHTPSVPPRAAYGSQAYHPAVPQAGQNISMEQFLRWLPSGTDNSMNNPQVSTDQGYQAQQSFFNPLQQTQKHSLAQINQPTTEPPYSGTRIQSPHRGNTSSVPLAAYGSQAFHPDVPQAQAGRLMKWQQKYEVLDEFNEMSIEELHSLSKDERKRLLKCLMQNKNRQNEWSDALKEFDAARRKHSHTWREANEMSIEELNNLTGRKRKNLLNCLRRHQDKKDKWSNALKQFEKEFDAARRKHSHTWREANEMSIEELNNLTGRKRKNLLNCLRRHQDKKDKWSNALKQFEDERKNLRV